MGTGSLLGVKNGQGVTLTPHPLLVPWSWKGRAIPLLPLWAVRPVQSLGACTRVHFTFLPFMLHLWYFLQRTERTTWRLQATRKSKQFNLNLSQIFPKVRWNLPISFNILMLTYYLFRLHFTPLKLFPFLKSSTTSLNSFILFTFHMQSKLLRMRHLPQTFQSIRHSKPAIKLQKSTVEILYIRIFYSFKNRKYVAVFNEVHKIIAEFSDHAG